MPLSSLPIDRNQTKSHLVLPVSSTTAKLDPNNPIVKRGLKRLKLAMKYEEPNRTKSLQDIKFYDGEQWNPDDVTKRTNDGRPILTFNVCGTFVRQVMANIRINKPRMKVVPIGGPASRNVAMVYDGIIRSIESKSKADQIYDEVSKQMVTGGFGFMRVDQYYCNTDMFERELRIRWIPNQFAVYFDPLPFDLDSENATWALITSSLLRDEFIEEYPNIPAASLPEVGSGDNVNWFKKDEVKIAEYFEREPYEDILVQLSTKQVMYIKDAEEYIAQMTLGLNIASLTNPMAANISSMLEPPKIVQQRKVTRYRVWRYLICGVAILEGPNLVPGELIPIIPVLGDMTIVDGERRYKGLIRDAQDPQRRLNYWVTTETEVVANQPRVPWLATAAQIKGHEDEFNDGAKKSLSVITYNFVNEEDTGSPAPSPKRLDPPQVSPGMMEAAGKALEDMKMAVGIFGPSLGQQPTRDTSGETMDRVQGAGDLNSFLYIDNLTRSLRLLGRILIGMIPVIYDTPRMIQFKNHMDEDMQVQINWQDTDPISGLPLIINDLSIGTYDVDIITGPPYMTARLEAKEGMIEFAKVFPAAAPALMDLVARTSDWPFAEELTRRLEMVMNPMFKRQKPGEQQSPPNPQMELMKIQMESQKQIALSKAQYEKLKALKAAVELEKTKNSDIKKTVLDTLDEILKSSHQESIMGNQQGAGMGPASSAPNINPQ